jgi:hypothetical protein
MRTVSTLYHVIPGTYVTVCLITATNGTQALGYTIGDPMAPNWGAARDRAYAAAQKEFARITAEGPSPGSASDSDSVRGPGPGPNPGSDSISGPAPAPDPDPLKKPRLLERPHASEEY